MRVRVRHETRYRFERAALLGPHVVRLHPAEHARARLLSYNMQITPRCEMRWQQDPAGNRIVRATFPAGLRSAELAIVVDVGLDIRPVNPFDFFVEDWARDVPFKYSPALVAELTPYLAVPSLGPRARAFVESLPARGYVTDWLVEVNRIVAKEVRYIIRNEPGIQTSEATLEIGSGSCRDSARLLVDVFRARGLAARFVSGYLVQLTDEGDIPDLQKGVSSDVVDLHAWAEVYVPGGGWIGLDGTSGLLCGEGHVPLASTAEPAVAAPIDGSASELGQLVVTMAVERVGHEPSPRRPYTEEQWSDLAKAGARADASLARSGLVVTMGGEPSWVSREHPLEPEWNTTALGPTKWNHGLRMARELAPRLGHGTLTMHRMGKQYPGESLPRWVLHMIWRADEMPVWRDLRRLEIPRAVLNGRGEIDERAADRFARALGRRLGLGEAPIPGYEDPWAHITREENLPDDVDPLAYNLDDPEERRSLARVLGRGLGRPVGYAYPLARELGRWTTSRWTFRRKHMFLIPGDSPMGLRLPLDRVNGKAPPFFVRDPTFTPPGPPEVRRQVPGDPPFAYPSLEGVLRTALCVEPREGVLHVFLPPLPTAEDFLELVATVEDTTVETGIAVRVEGYPPPPDPRLRHCMITPDPGVLEVNVPVTETFEQYTKMMETVADAARHAGLTTLTLQVDGREAGTGGGHHLTLGGPSPLESPFLRRPDLLASLIRYLQNHPSLSYLFTGLFVGPTSQAPRFDEARHDSLYELEIALTRVPRFGSSDRAIPPWLVDRLFRNILVDVTGNTHRTEVCIDKLYDPGGVAGRQGLIELRAFEMPPHERMAVAQMLLARSLVAMFAARPYERPLIRWGSELHDRFMLPHYLWADFEDVLDDLKRADLPLDPGWYQPFLELRCPVLGTMAIDDVNIELRAAIEPWPVLGEEPGATGTVRYVDSSVERLEVKVDGLTEGRHLLLVNGLTLPLRPTGRASQRVAGVRYRAWQPPFSLQPTIGVHHPLRFDVLDTWAARSLGACTYHVWHPEGRAYTERPLTLAEAAARRAARFTTLGHAPSPVIPMTSKPHPEQPFTLDLRRYPIDVRPSEVRPVDLTPTKAHPSETEVEDYRHPDTHAARSGGGEAPQHEAQRGEPVLAKPRS